MSTRVLIETKRPNVPFVDLGAQYRTIEINQAIAKVIRETDFILGREVHVFEEEFVTRTMRSVWTPAHRRSSWRCEP